MPICYKNNTAPEDIKNMYTWFDQHKPKYGGTFHANEDNFLPFLKCLTINSILDVGTGRGDFCNWAIDELCDTVIGLDLAIQPRPEFTKKNIKFITAPAHNIPLPDKCVDMTVSFDVLEHVRPEDISKTITEMVRVTKRCMLHCVSKSPSKTAVAGKKLELHLIQQHRITWRDDIFLKAHPNFKFIKVMGRSLFIII